MAKNFNKGDKVFIHSQKKRGEVLNINNSKNVALVEFTKKDEDKRLETIRKEFTFDEIDIYKPKEIKKRGVNLWAKTNPNGIIPSKRREDAGYDIYACFEEDELLLKQLHPNKVPTGIASSIPPEYYWNIKHERGTTGKYAMLLLSGCIDSGYRGEWFINICPLYKDIVISKTYNFPVEDGKKKPVELDDKIMYPYEMAVAQAVKLPVPDDEDKEIPYDKLLTIKSERGQGVEGSSGK